MNFLIIFYCNSVLKSHLTYKFIHLPGEYQSFKTLDQIAPIQDLVDAEFKCKDSEKNDADTLKILYHYDIYQYRTHDDLISNLYIHTDTYSGLIGIGDYEQDNIQNNKNYIINDIINSQAVYQTVLCLYSVFTNQKFRNQGFGKKLLYDAVKNQVYYLNKHDSQIFKTMKKIVNTSFSGLNLFFNNFNFNLNLKKPFNTDFILALHLNPQDTMMNFNYAFYYSLGFKLGSFCEYGPPSFSMNLEKMLNFQDPRKIVKNPEICSEKGNFLCMITTYENFLNHKHNKIDKDMIYEGERLREILLERKK